MNSVNPRRCARRLCIALLRYLCPLAILAVFAANIY